MIWAVLAPSLVNWNRFNFEKSLYGKRVLGGFFSKQLITSTHKKNGLACMDSATADAVFKGTGTNNNEASILPVAVDVGDARSPTETGHIGERIRISYIGRSDDLWKIKPVKRIISNLALINAQFDLNIYTDSEIPFLMELENISAPNISFKFHVGIYGASLREHLASNSDLHFSMGISALEGALSGLPTVLVDPSYVDIPDGYRYRWLHETEGFSLGRFVSGDASTFPGHTMAQLIDALRDPTARLKAAQACSAYVIKNHAAREVVAQLLALNSQATNADLFRFTPSAWKAAECLHRARNMLKDAK